MARAKNPPHNDGKKTPWLLIILLIVLAAGGSAAGVYFFMNRQAPAGGENVAAAAPVVAADPIFITIAPFTVNLLSERSQQHLLYIGLTLKVSDKPTQDFVNQYMPQVRSRLLMLMSGQKAEDLVTPNGKDVLTAQILQLFQTPLATPQPQLGVIDVLYTDFIVQ